MISVLVEVDTQHARLVKYMTTGPEHETLKDSGPEHHTETLGRNHPVHQTDQERFYKKVAERLVEINPKEMYVGGTGPGLEHFMNYLGRKAPQLQTKVLLSEKFPALTDAQLVDHGMHFFKKAHVFQSL